MIHNIRHSRAGHGVAAVLIPGGSKTQSRVLLGFLARFLIGLVIAGLLAAQFITRCRGVMETLTAISAAMCRVAMAILPGQAAASGNMVSYAGFDLKIIDECTGIFEMLIYAVAVLSFPASFRRRAIGIGLGIPAIFALNLLRIMFLLVVGAHWHSAYEFFHLFFWQLTMILMIGGIWILWLWKVVGHETKSGHIPA